MIKSKYRDVYVCINPGFYFYENTRLPVTRWVKLSLNFELLVPK